MKVIGKQQRSEQPPALMQNLAAMMRCLGTLKTWKQACYSLRSSMCQAFQSQNVRRAQQKWSCMSVALLDQDACSFAGCMSEM